MSLPHPTSLTLTNFHHLKMLSIMEEVVVFNAAAINMTEDYSDTLHSSFVNDFKRSFLDGTNLVDCNHLDWGIVLHLCWYLASLSWASQLPYSSYYGQTVTLTSK